jgi:hypothetical protein
VRQDPSLPLLRSAPDNAVWTAARLMPAPYAATAPDPLFANDGADHAYGSGSYLASMAVSNLA